MLLTPEQFLSFLGAAIIITASPGPDNLMILSVGMSRGRKQGTAFGLGCALGCLSHTLLATLGISALIAASPLAFLLLKISGGLYLIYLGIQSLRHPSLKDQPPRSTTLSDDSLLTLFFKGLIANSINPKVILFFLSFLPQFLLPDKGDAGWQTVLLGLTFTTQAVILFSLLGYFSGTAGQWLATHSKTGLWIDKLAGCILIALGLRLLFLL